MEKIAINIDERRNEEIKNKLVDALKSADLDCQVECFNNAHDIYSYCPDILIGHINDTNSTLISNPPASLKWFHAMSAGVDKVIDKFGRSLRKHDIRLSNVRGIHRAAMREYVLSMILYFEKDISRWVAQKCNAEWIRAPLSCLPEKQILIYGVGNIGKEVGRVSNFLGMRAVGISNSGRYVEGFEKVYQPGMLKECVKVADYIVITAPKTSNTEGVFSKELLDLVNQDAVIINVSRGELIDEKYLVNLLNEGKIRGAALDVFCEEPLPQHSELWSCKNLMITPHISGLFADGMGLGIECFIDNLKVWRSTGQLLNEVSIVKGY